MPSGTMRFGSSSAGRETRPTPKPQTSSRRMRSSAAARSMSVSGTGGGLSLRCRAIVTWPGPTIQPVVRTSSWRSRSPTQFSSQGAGHRSSTSRSDKLLTPVGLRSLSPDDPNFKPTYHGDLKTRDAAYHQGTVWAWLIGPFIDAWLKVYPHDRQGARRFLEGFIPHLRQEACIGSISEVFDAAAPFAPRGCIAQAWSVAEVLRCWTMTTEIPA